MGILRFFILFSLDRNFMAYDTIKLKSPPMDQSIIDRIQQKCFLRSGLHLETGELRYEIYNGELMGSWDSRISVITEKEDWVIGKGGRPEKARCEPYIRVEASIHKVLLGHNIYGGPTEFKQACSQLVELVEKLLEVELPSSYDWTVHRVDVANVFRLPKAACKAFFEGIQLKSFPRRNKNFGKYAMGVYFTGKTTTVKIYHKGSEFPIHDRSRLRKFFFNYFQFLHGKGDLKNKERTERKLDALQRLADNRLRIEVEIHADKFQYDFEKNPLVSEVSDEYLQRVHDTEIERLLREGKQGMETVRKSTEVLARLQREYGETKGLLLYGFWSFMTQHGDDKARSHYTKTTFYRNRKLLEEAGVSWVGTDIVIVANDSLLPVDFAPVRSDPRLCFLPARNREFFMNSRELMRLAA